MVRPEPRKIMVVDDEVHICEMLEEFLSMVGYRVVTTTRGDTALDLFEMEHPDIILLDVRMPGVSGIEVLERMKKSGRLFGAIMLSAFGDDRTIRDAMQAGANHYIQKPMDFQLLKEKLTNVEESLWEAV